MESKQFSFQDYYLISVDEVIKKFRTSDKGLSSHEAELRLHQHGFNELIEKKEVHPFKVLLRQ
ncbi:MAG TPA: cation-transporting P-type ATPase, partial [Candidatus Nanoarchaeia archaeon]|nr:cation-transporting P-type ATPase [Candidatus Nanoarchaeia archaeon]